MTPARACRLPDEWATDLLISRGYEPVVPVGSCFLSRYTRLHLAGLRGNYEALGVRLRIVYGAVCAHYIEHFCRFEICQFRDLLMKSPGDIFIRCEVWVISPNGSIHCFEVLPHGISEVAAYAE